MNCSKCKENKELDQFNKNKNKKTGYSNYCRDCSKLIAKQFKYNNPENVKKYDRNTVLKRFNLLETQYEEMLKEQNNKCGICTVDQNKINKRFAIDHDHTSGAIRGLLCFKCNCAIGLLQDEPAKAIAYLNKYK